MRTHFCGELNKKNLDQDVTLCGWVNRRRDHGGVIFLDVRDKKGLAQVVINPETIDTFKLAETIRNEFVLKITGKVIARDNEMINNKISTGEIEVLANHIEILNASTVSLLIPRLLNHSIIGWLSGSACFGGDGFLYSTGFTYDVSVLKLEPATAPDHSQW